MKWSIAQRLSAMFALAALLVFTLLGIGVYGVLERQVVRYQHAGDPQRHGETLQRMGVGFGINTDPQVHRRPHAFAGHALIQRAQRMLALALQRAHAAVVAIGWLHLWGPVSYTHLTLPTIYSV